MPKKENDMTIECGHKVVFDFGGKTSCMLCKADVTPPGRKELTRPVENHNKVLDSFHNRLVEELTEEN